MSIRARRDGVGRLYDPTASSVAALWVQLAALLLIGVTGFLQTAGPTKSEARLFLAFPELLEKHDNPGPMYSVPLALTLTGASAAGLDGVMVPRAALAGALARALETRERSDIVFDATDDTPLGVAVAALDIAREAQARRTWMQDKGGFPWQLAVAPEPIANVPGAYVVRTKAKCGGARPVFRSGPVDLANTGFSLDSMPTNARVFVDGVDLVRRTPIRVTGIEHGDHVVRLESEGHASWQAPIHVTRGVVVELPTAMLLRAPPPRSHARAVPEGVR